MAQPSYTTIRAEIEQQLAGLGSTEARQHLIGHLANLTFEMNRVKDYQQVLLAALRARDVVVAEHRHVKGLVASPSFALDMREALDVSGGFHDLEWAGETAVRWTGPGHETVIRLWLDRSMPMMLDIIVHAFGDERNRAAITLRVDGVALALAPDGDHRLRSDPLAVLPASLYTEIALHVPFLSPSGEAVDGAEAARPRGIAIAGLRFIAMT